MVDAPCGLSHHPRMPRTHDGTQVFAGRRHGRAPARRRPVHLSRRGAHLSRRVALAGRRLRGRRGGGPGSGSQSGHGPGNWGRPGRSGLRQGRWRWPSGRRRAKRHRRPGFVAASNRSPRVALHRSRRYLASHAPNGVHNNVHICGKPRRARVGPGSTPTIRSRRTDPVARPGSSRSGCGQGNLALVPARVKRIVTGRQRSTSGAVLPCAVKGNGLVTDPPVTTGRQAGDGEVTVSWSCRLPRLQAVERSTWGGCLLRVG